MALWDPFRDYTRLEREIGKMFDDFWGGRKGILGRLPAPGKTEVPAERIEELRGIPVVDLMDKKNSLVLKAEMPGVDKKDIKVTVTDEEVSISGKIQREKEEKGHDYYCCERSYGLWQRSISLPVKVESGEAKATYKNGVLEVTLPKSEEAKEKRKELTVE